MLSDADIQLVLRDPTLKGLRHCLDLEVVTGKLQEFFPELGVQSLTCNYIRYKPGRNCLLGYEAQTSQGKRWLHAKAFAESEVVKLQKIAHAAAGIRQSVVHVVEQDDYYIALFPYDVAIPALGAVERMESIDQRILREVRAEEGSVTCFRYKPERRVVGQVRFGGAQTTGTTDSSDFPLGSQLAVLRMYDREGYQSAARRWKIALPDLGLVTPRRLANCQSIAALATEWIPGEFFSSSDPRSLREFSLRIPELCDCLSRLHVISEANLPVRSPEVTSTVLKSLANDLMSIVPRHEARIGRLFHEVQQRVVDARYPYTMIHGDLHLGQLLVVPGGLALLDWDELAHGDPASDLAGLVAQLAFDAIDSGNPVDQIGSVTEMLRKEYNRNGRGIGDSHWRTALAVAVCRLCMQPFRIRSDQWDQKIEALLQFAADVLQPEKRRPLRSPSEAPSTNFVPMVSPDSVVADCESLGLNPLELLTADRLLPMEWQSSTSHATSSQLRRIRVTRHKPKRRMVLEYDLECMDISGEMTNITVVGKVRFRGLKSTAYSTQAWLAAQGLTWQGIARESDPTACAFQVPRVLGTVPEAGMWLQEYRSGLTVTSQLHPSQFHGGIETALPRRIARGLSDLHHRDFPCQNVHTWEDELAILERRIDEAAVSTPSLESRFRGLKRHCRDLAGNLMGRPQTGIHRDFYPAQILVDGPFLVFLDFDLACRGDPAVDAGNFIAHVIEHSVRHFRDPERLAAFAGEFRDEYVQRSGVPVEAIEVYTTLSLARLVTLSRSLPHRESTTNQLLEICENRLADHAVKIS
jgi:aminoglycoside phosphotransferase (APT) family kinase protein